MKDIKQKIAELKISSGRKGYITKLLKKVQEVKNAKIIYFNNRYTF